MKEALSVSDEMPKCLKSLNLNKCTKEQLKSSVRNCYELEDFLFSAIKDDSTFLQCPDRLRLPLLFYYGHTSTVFVNKMRMARLISEKERVDFEIEKMLETGVDEMSWDDTENYRMGSEYKWPAISEIREYRKKVEQLIYEVIDRTPLVLPINWTSQWWGLLVGINHFMIHFETSAVLIRQLPVDMVQRPLNWKYAPFHREGATELTNELIKIHQCEITMGKPFSYPTFGWDNEYGKLTCTVEEFQVSKFKVTNEEFLQFVNSGGYNNPSFWTTEGWTWKCGMKRAHPIFWVCDENCRSNCGSNLSGYSHCSKSATTLSTENFSRPEFPFRYRLMFDVIDMPKNWPVIVNYHEAKAFCAWKGPEYRVLGEAEHHALREQKELDDLESDPALNEFDLNINFKYGSSTPVDFYPPNSKGIYDVYGNVWEWCEDHFNGLPAFRTHFLYDDFSTPCYDGRHNIIMGGSWISTRDESSKFARFMFRRHFYQFCGFRIVLGKKNSTIRLIGNDTYIQGHGFIQNAVTIPSTALENLHFYRTENTQHLYENNGMLMNTLIEEYYEPNNVVSEVLNILLDIFKTHKSFESFIHFGCGTGRIAFEVSNIMKKVVGVDFVGILIDAAIALQNESSVNCSDAKTKKNKIFAHKFPLALRNLSVSQQKDRIQFKQFTWVPNELNSTDVVLFTFYHRLQNPKAWLKRMDETINDGGIFMATVPRVGCFDAIEDHLGGRFHFLNFHTYDFKSKLSKPWDHSAHGTGAIGIWKKIP